MKPDYISNTKDIFHKISFLTFFFHYINGKTWIKYFNEVNLKKLRFRVEKINCRTKFDGRNHKAHHPRCVKYEVKSYMRPTITQEANWISFNFTSSGNEHSSFRALLSCLPIPLWFVHPNNNFRGTQYIVFLLR